MASDIREQDVGTAPRKRLRVWPAVVMVILLWGFLIGSHFMELDPGHRFMSRMMVQAVLLLAFLGWWLSRSAISWRDRLGAIAVVLVVGYVVRMAGDKKLDSFGLLLASFPWVITAWTALLLVGRNWSAAARRIGFCAVMMLAIGFFALVRFEGLYASQQAEYNWRWTPTAEEQFLHTHGGEHVAAADVAGGKTWTIRSGDTAEFRGANRDGVITDVKLATDWKAHPPKLLWWQRVGPGWSSMIVVDDHLVTQEQREEQEAVVCYDAATGKEVWAHTDKTRFEDSLSGAGPRGTPTFSDGKIYAQGGRGLLNCLNAATGELIWSRDAANDAGVGLMEYPQWGYSVSPLVVDGLVVVFAGGKLDEKTGQHDKSWLAYHADSGELAWTVPGGDQSYSSPQVVTLQGRRQLLLHDNRALMSVDIQDGKLLWERLSQSAMALPMLQPHASESNGVLISAESGVVMLDVAEEGGKWSATDRWASMGLRANFNDFVIHDGRIYGLSDGILSCLDLATGERLWKKGRYGASQVTLLADVNQLLLATEAGEIILLGIKPEGCEELGRFQAIEGKTWNNPVLNRGRIYLRNSEEMAGYELPLVESPEMTTASAR